MIGLGQCLVLVTLVICGVAAASRPSSRDFRIPINPAHRRGEANFATRPRYEVGQRMRNFSRTASGMFAFEQGIGYYYQFDIMLKPETDQNALPLGANANIRWPNAIVPFQITASNFTSTELANIQTVIKQYAATTCVRFVPRTTETNYIRIDNSASGCWSYVGRSTNNAYNLVNLQNPGCMSTGTVAHEFMHSLGFYHEFTRPDRDEWVSIDIGALNKTYQTQSFYNANFAKQSYDQVQLYGIPYSYGSVMHYSKYGGAVSRSRPVMNNLKLWVGDFGSNVGLTAVDIKAINYMYCNNTVVPTTAPTVAPPVTTTQTTTKAPTTINRLSINVNTSIRSTGTKVCSSYTTPVKYQICFTYPRTPIAAVGVNFSIQWSPNIQARGTQSCVSGTVTVNSTAVPFGLCIIFT